MFIEYKKGGLTAFFWIGQNVLFGRWTHEPIPFPSYLKDLKNETERNGS